MTKEHKNAPVREGMPVQPAEASELRLVDVTDSTNDDAKSLALAGAPHGSAVAARVQRAGRGRRGHGWSSPRGGLYLSVVLRPEVPMQYYMGLSAVCALGVLEALREDAGMAKAALKWPNDVVLGEGKLAGILVEAGSSPQGPYAVCGVGVNLEPLAQEGEGACPFDSPGALQAACAAEVAGATFEFERLARAVRDRVCALVDMWAAEVRRGRAFAGPLTPVLNEYFDVVPLLGHRVGVYAPAGALLDEGMFAGVDCWGRAVVRLRGGDEVAYAAEQVSLRALS